jgi:hypothetical protein
MKPRKKTYRRKVTALIDGTPSFVSLVDRGASGSPFTSVKKEDSPMKIKARAVAAPEKKTAAKSNKAVETAEKRNKVASEPVKTETAITKFVFQKSAGYETVDDVKAFMENSDFEGEMTFEDTDETIVVYNADVTERTVVKESDITTGEDGVVATVAHLLVADAEQSTVSKSDDMDDEDDDEDDEDDDMETSTGKGKGKKKPMTAEKSDDEEDEEDEDEEDDIEKSEDSKKKPGYKAEEKPVTLSKREQFLANLKKQEEQVVVRKFDHYEVWAERNETDFASLMKAGMSDGAAPGLEDVLWTFGQSVRKSLRKGGDVGEQLRKDAASMVDLVIAQNELFSTILEADKEEVAKAEKSYDDLQKWATDFGKSLLKEDDEKSSVTKSDTPATNNTVIAVDVASEVEKHIAPIVETVQKLAKTVDKIATRKQVSKSVPTSELSTDEPATGKSKETTTKSSTAANNLAQVVFGR